MVRPEMTQEGDTGAYHPTLEGNFDGLRRLRVEFRPEGEGHRPAVRMTTTFKRGGASGARARETFIENHLAADDSYTSHYVEEEQPDGTWASAHDHIKRAPAKRR